MHQISQQQPFPMMNHGQPFSPIGGQNPMMGMMMMFGMMMEMMEMIMSSMMGGQSPMSAHSPGFGSGMPYQGGAASTGNFLGQGSSNGNSAAGGASPMTGAFAPPSDGSTNAKTQNFINKATAKQGAPYVFGAQGNGKYDCSGLVHAALNEAGVKGGRLTARGYQAKYKNSRVAKNDLKPGDLVFFHSKNKRGIPAGKATHIEIYLGNGMTMGTDNPKEGARIEPINWKTFIGGARVPELNQ